MSKQLDRIEAKLDKLLGKHGLTGRDDLMSYTDISAEFGVSKFRMRRNFPDMKNHGGKSRTSKKLFARDDVIEAIKKFGINAKK